MIARTFGDECSHPSSTFQIESYGDNEKFELGKDERAEILHVMDENVRTS